MNFNLKQFTLVGCLILALVVAGCNGENIDAENTYYNDADDDTVMEEPATNDSLNSNTNTSNMENVDQLAMPQAGEEIVVLETNVGTIKARLFPDLVPETYKNFKYHIEEGNYNGTIFHRVIEDFMIQGGDIENMDGRGGYSYKGEGTTIGEEFDENLRHHRGALSMAKTMFPSTTGSQFFIVHAEDGTPHLDDAHSVFGQVFEGMDVVDEIAAVEKGAMDKPVEDVVLEEVRLEKYEQ